MLRTFDGFKDHEKFAPWVNKRGDLQKSSITALYSQMYHPANVFLQG